jgi:tetratricopeptide (TPR) repeat protein
MKIVDPIDRKIWLKAIDYATNKKISSSLKLYEKLLYKYPENPNINYEASLLFIHQGKYKCAYECMEKIFENFQNNINYLNDFSVVCTKLAYFEKAEYLSNRAFQAEPNNSNHLINLAAIYNFMGNFEAALNVIDRAIKINPIESKYYNLMGVTLVKSGLDSLARKMFEISFALDNKFIDAKVNLAVLDSKAGDHFSSIKELEQSMKIINENELDSISINQIKYLLSYDYLAVGNLQKGWDYYDFGFDLNIQHNSRRNPTRTFKKPRWNGVVKKDKTLLIWREQGIGDEILFYTCLPDLVNLDLKIIVECEERLVEILSRSFPTFVIRKENYNHSNLHSHQEDYDYHLPVGSLMQYFRSDIRKFNLNVPIFKINEKLAKSHEDALIQKNSFKKRIGICWRSGLLDMERNNHYLIIEDLAPIFENKNFDFINLQYGDCEEELLLIENMCDVNIIRWKDLDLKEEIDSVIALISRLDLVITVGTAVSSLAGSIGKPVFRLASKDWINLGTDYLPFFPSTECFFPSEAKTVADCIPYVNDRLLEKFG